MFTKTLFDRELAIAENRVNVGKILQNSSLIMGKQIINILPEGQVNLISLHQVFLSFASHFGNLKSTEEPLLGASSSISLYQSFAMSGKLI